MIKNMTMGVVSLPSNAGGRILEPLTVKITASRTKCPSNATGLIVKFLRR
jgi:hypothetical protein